MDEPELEGPKGFRSRVHVHRGAVNQDFGGLGFAPIQFTVARFDTLGEWFTGAGNWHFRPRRPGWYLIHASAAPLNAIPVGQWCRLIVRYTGPPWIAEESRMGDGTTWCFTRVTTIVHLLPTDLVQAWWWTSIAAPNDWLSGDPNRTYLVIHRLS